MSALGQKRTFALHQPMSALPPIATAKADICPRSCPLYPQKRTCAVHSAMSALGQKRTCAATRDIPLSADSEYQNAYSITSSAMAITPDGMAKPRALAVFKLMTNSNLVGVCT